MSDRLAEKIAIQRIAKKFADMAELEQIKARNAEHRAEDGRANYQVIQLGERDKHIARAGAFLEAARMALATIA